MGRSEVLRGSQNPVFAHVFALDYFFEEMQMLKFEVFDDGGEGAEDGGSELGPLLGAIECSLGQVRLVVVLPHRPSEGIVQQWGIGKAR